METTTFQRQYPLALVALGEHMATHELAAPTSIEVVQEYRDGHKMPAISVRLPVFPDQQDAWVRSVCIDDTDIEERELGHRMAWSVRLPESGFRFIFVALRAHAVMRPVSA